MKKKIIATIISAVCVLSLSITCFGADSPTAPVITTQAPTTQKPTTQKPTTTTKAPTKVKIVKATVKKSTKKISIKFIKQTGVKRYQIKVSTNHKFTNNVKYYYTRNVSKTTFKYSKLSKNKKGTPIYIKVRGYSIKKGKKVFKKWSAVTKIYVDKK